MYLALRQNVVGSCRSLNICVAFVLGGCEESHLFACLIWVVAEGTDVQKS